MQTRQLCPLNKSVIYSELGSFWGLTCNHQVLPLGNASCSPYLFPFHFGFSFCSPEPIPGGES